MITDQRVIRQVAAWCLSYPDEELLGRSGLLREALAELRPSEPARRLRTFLDYLSAAPPRQRAEHYVEIFDLSRRRTLYLSYWTDGDTRRRGATLAAIKRRYRDSGFLVDTQGELPDYLPLMLEFAAVADPAAGTALLQEHRAGLELIRLALVERETPYAEILAAVCATLPGPAPRDRAAAIALAGPPTESVGIELLPYPRLRT